MINTISSIFSNNSSFKIWYTYIKTSVSAFYSMERKRERVLFNASSARVWAYGSWCCRSTLLRPACCSIYKADIHVGLIRPFCLWYITKFCICSSFTGSSKLFPPNNISYNPAGLSCPLFLQNNSVFGAHSANSFTPLAVFNIALDVNSLLSVKLNSFALCDLAFEQKKGWSRNHFWPHLQWTSTSLCPNLSW